jgi:hypothetical protein
MVRTLVGRFKEFRRDKKPRNARKQESPSERAAPPTKRKAPGITRSVCSPVPPDGEDTTSFERHTNTLQAEYSKTSKNMEIVIRLMERSYAHRRMDILSKGSDVMEILNKFPFLQDPSYVS